MDSSAITPNRVTIERDPLTGKVHDIVGDTTALLGVDATELLNDSGFVNRVHSADLAHVAPAVSDSDTLLYRLRHADGSHVWVAEQLGAFSDQHDGAVISQLAPAETTVRLAQFSGAINRFSEAVAIFELGDTPDSTQQSVIVVAANEAGAELLGEPGQTLTAGDLETLNGDDGDFVTMLATVIGDQEPFACILGDGTGQQSSTLSAECIDQASGLVLVRRYETNAGEATDHTPMAAAEQLDEEIAALALDTKNDFDVLNNLIDYFDLTSCSTWHLEPDNGRAERLLCDDDSELPAGLDLSGAALHRLSQISTAVTSPDPAVEALRRRLDEQDRDGIAGRNLAIVPRESDEILVADANTVWTEDRLAKLLLAADLLGARRPVEDHAATRSSQLASHTSELLHTDAPATLFDSIEPSGTDEPTKTLALIGEELRAELEERFDVEEVEIWTLDSAAATTTCAEFWASASESLGATFDAPRWVHVVPQTTGTACGAVRFVSSTAQWNTEALLSLDTVADQIWQNHQATASTTTPQTSGAMSAAFENAPLAAAVLSPDGTMTACNQRCATFLGSTDRDDLVGTALSHHATIDGRQQLSALLRGDAEISLDVPFRRLDDTIVWGRVHVSTFLTEQGQPQTIANIEDVTDSILRQRALEYRVEHDDLTLLATRQRLTTSLAELDVTDHSPATLLLIDLDAFESIRDRYGRDQADQVLRVVADRLRTLVRPTDLVARTGPAEFGILLDGDESDALALADRLLKSISDPVLVRHTEISTTANVGITSIAATDQVSSVMRKADNALDAAKSTGRLSSATFDNALFEQLEREERLEADLNDAISSGEIVMHYQPEVSLRTGELLGFETLARWEHPEFGLLESEEFVAHAERIGVIRDIDELALRTACQQMADWQQAYPDRVRNIRINVSGTSIRSTSFLEILEGSLAEHHIADNAFWLEVSEDDLLQDEGAPIDHLNTIKDLGCKVLIDDFGHGLSSFAALRRLPVDALEITPALVGALGADPDANTIVSATIQLAQTLGLECVAEGVETHQQMHELIELGCQRAHGFLYGAPAPGERYNEIIREGRIDVFDSKES